MDARFLRCIADGPTAALDDLCLVPDSTSLTSLLSSVDVDLHAAERDVLELIADSHPRWCRVASDCVKWSGRTALEVDSIEERACEIDAAIRAMEEAKSARDAALARIDQDSNVIAVLRCLSALHGVGSSFDLGMANGDIVGAASHLVLAESILADPVLDRDSMLCVASSVESWADRRTQLERDLRRLLSHAMAALEQDLHEAGPLMERIPGTIARVLGNLGSGIESVYDADWKDAISVLKAVMVKWVETEVVPELASIVSPEAREELSSIPVAIERVVEFEQRWFYEGFTGLSSCLRNENYTLRFARLLAARFLGKARELILTDGFDATTYTHRIQNLPKNIDDEITRHGGVSDPNTAIDWPLPLTLFRFPDCVISTSILGIEQLLRECMDEAVQCDDEASAVSLVDAARRIVDLFMLLGPSVHERVLTTVPALAAQFYNDCMYLAHVAGHIGHDYRYRMSGVLFDTPLRFVDRAGQLQMLGEHVLGLQLCKQGEQIAEFFEEMDGIYELEEAGRREEVERGLTQVIFTLKQLNSVWKSTLPRKVTCIAIGALASEALRLCTVEVQRLVDISEAESGLLHDMLGQFMRDVVGLVEENVSASTDDAASVDDYVSHHGHFQQLVDMMQMSFAEIMRRLRSGDLAMFGVEELCGLVCALFSDTPLRVKNLAEIRTGVGLKETAAAYANT